MPLPNRKRIRLKDYDYSQNGLYYVTICSHDRQCIFGEIVGATCGRQQVSTKLSDIGKIIESEIINLPMHYNGVITVEKYVIMPNHIHMMILIDDYDKKDIWRPQVAPTLSRVIQQFKGSITKKVWKRFWQKSFYENIVRNEKSYQEIWEYVDTNPLKWQLDKYYKEN